MFEVKKINYSWIGIIGLIQLIYFLPGIEYEYQDLKLYLAVILSPLIIIYIYLSKLTIKINKIIFILLLPIFLDISNGFYSGNIRNYLFYYDLNVYILSLSYAIIYWIYKDERENEYRISLLSKLLLGICIAIIVINVIFSTYSYHGQPIGKIFTGNQNLSSIILLLSMPLLKIIEKNLLRRLIYFITVIAVMGLLIKNRLPIIIASLYMLHELIGDNKKIKFNIAIITLVVILLITTFIFNDRFQYLLSSDIYIRLNSWQRLIYASLDNFYFGYGLGSLSYVYNFYQYINPETEIILGGDTFFFAHNQSLDKLITGGIFSLILYWVINGIILIKGFFVLFRKKCSLEIRQVYKAYLIFLLVSQYDINSNYFGTNIWFLLFQVILLSHFFKDTIIINRKFFVAIFIILMAPAIIQFGFTKHLTNHYNIYNLMIAKINTKQNINSEIEVINDISPHFGVMDTIKSYNYLFTTKSSNFNSFEFEEYLKNAEKYNKYNIQRFRISSQYYAAKNLNNELINVYEDLLYKQLILHKVINVKFKRDNLKINFSTKAPKLIIGDDSILMGMPSSLFSDLKLINTSKGQFELPNEVIEQIIIDTTVTNEVRLNTNELKALRAFYVSINDFSKPLIFNK